MSADIIGLLGQLVDSKHKANQSEGASSPQNFDDILSEKVASHLAHLQNDDKLSWVKQQLNKYSDIREESCTIRWRFVLCCLNCFTCLRQIQQDSLHKFNQDQQCTSEKKGRSQFDAPPLSPDTLSVSQQKTVLSSLQFITGLSVCPYLLPGVGVPLERRSGFGEVLQETSKPVSNHVKAYRLFKCTEVLYECSKTPSLGSIILSRHLGDILAAMLQIGHTCKPDAERTEYMAQIETTTCSISRENITYCTAALEDIVGRVYSPMLIRELLMLQGGPAPTKASKSLRHPSTPSGLQRAPVWLRKATAALLSQQVMKPNGIQNLLLCMLQGPAQPNDDRKCDAVAKVIAHCPKQSISVDDYYSLVCPQILQLLQNEDKQVSPRFLRVACSTILAMHELQTSLAETYIFKPMLSPLQRCCHLTDSFDSETIVVEESELTKCIENIHKVFVCGSEPNSSLMSKLQLVIQPLFRLYIYCKEGVSHLRATCSEILVSFLRMVDLSIALRCLKALSYHDEEARSIPQMSEYIDFKPGSQGGIVIVSKSDVESEVMLGEMEARSQCVVEMVNHVQRDGLPAEFFLAVLQDLTSVISKAKTKQTSMAEQEGDDLLQIERRQMEAVQTMEWKLGVLSLLSCLIDALGPDCLTNTGHILEFVKVTLDRGVVISKSSEESNEGAFENETLTMAMGLLTVILSGAVHVSTEDRDKTKELLPMLEALSQHHDNESVQQMAADLRIAVATHGAVWSDSLPGSKGTSSDNLPASKGTSSDNLPDSKGTSLDKPSASKGTSSDTLPASKGTSSDNLPASKGTSLVNSPATGTKAVKHENVAASNLQTLDNESPSQGSSSANIEDLSKLKLQNDGDNSTCASEVKTKVSSAADYKEKKDLINDVHHKTGKSSENLSRYSQCMREINDVLIPVQGHGLIILKKLIEANDFETLKHCDEILKVLLHCVQHTDTYVYLGAIQAMASLAERIPDKLVPVVAQEFLSEDATLPESQRTEVRLKMGEVLMKATRALGDITPQYRDVIVSVCLTGARDRDPLVRASSVSNLGEVCKLLRFSLGNVLQEIFSCCSSLLKTDADVDVRRAAALLLTLLLQGLGRDALKVLEDIMRDLYKLLKFVRSTEQDDKVLLHTQLSLEELDTITRDFLFPKQTFTKRIRVLDP